MASLNYPVVLQADDNGAILVTFPDIPEAATYGDDRADALAHAVDALDAAIAFRVRDKEDIPTPSPARGRPTVTLPLQTVLKALIYQTMRDNGVRKATLKRRLGWNDPQVDRLLDPRHATRLAHLDAAIKALGFEVDVRMRPLPTARKSAKQARRSRQAVAAE